MNYFRHMYENAKLGRCPECGSEKRWHIQIWWGAAIGASALIICVLYLIGVSY